MIAGCLVDVCYGFDCTPSWVCCSLVAFSLLLRLFVSLVVGGYVGLSGDCLRCY